MEELYSIMEDFLEVEYAQKSLMYVLEALENAYCEPYCGQEQPGAKMVANHARNSIKSIQEGMRAAISRLDRYITASAEHRTV